MCGALTASTYRSLATNAETADQSAIALDISALHVVEQTASLADELHQSTAGVMITLVDFEVLGEWAIRSVRIATWTSGEPVSVA